MSVKVDDILVIGKHIAAEIAEKICHSPILKEDDFMKKINWKVRFNRENILFIGQVAMSIGIPILAYFGLETSDLTTWAKVWETFVAAVSNPYVVVLAVVSLFNAITDPTTHGVGDSENAMTYLKPKK